MGDDKDPNQRSLVPLTARDLTTRSSALVRRGLDTLASRQARTIRFPPDRSIGKLYISDQANFGSEKEEELGEARGYIRVPEGKKVFLVVNNEAMIDLSPLRELNPNDLQGLELLDLDNLLSDEHLENFKGLTGLLGIRLGSFKISDSGLAHLRRLSKLKWLVITGTGISDAGLANLQALSELELLNLLFCQIGGEGLIYLRELTKLKSLSLLGLPIRDPELANLRELIGLEELHLTRCSVSDAAIIHLEKLTRLKQMTLSNTHVSSAGLTRLQQALPNCSVEK